MFQRAEVVAKELRLQGTTATAVKEGAITKVDAAAAADVSRPTLDRWVERMEAGKTITVDWDTQPDEVWLSGIRVSVRKDTAWLPAPEAHAAKNGGKAWFLTTREDDGVLTSTPFGNTDLRKVILGGSGAAVFDPSYLDAALVYLVNLERVRREKAAQRREATETALSELRAAAAAAEALKGQGGAAMEANAGVRRMAQEFYNAGTISQEQAREYAGPWLDE